MNTKKVISYGAIALMVSTSLSCNKMESDTNANLNEREDVEVFTQSNSILSFKDESDFLAAVQAVREGKSNPDAYTRSTSVENFLSIYDEFNQAMKEADDYYQREGGYEEFKTRFPNLYYPEHNGDYAAFLPVSDEIVAKFLNQSGKVMIAGKEKDLRDVWSYEKIQELGLAMPEESLDGAPETRAYSGYEQLTLDKKQFNKKRKAWITLRGIVVDTPLGEAKFGRVDLCFRKKGLLGWYNGEIDSRSYLIRPNPQHMVILDKIYYAGGPKIDEYSPHKYVVASRPASATSSSFGRKTLYFDVDYNDSDYAFNAYYDVDIDALLNMNNGTGFGEDIASLFNSVTYNFGFGFHYGN